MIPLVGVWAASQPAVFTRRWLPAAPVLTEHYFLVVSQSSDGSLQAFVRNPEYNIGAAVGLRTIAISGNDVALRAAQRPEIDGTVNTDGTLTLHRMLESNAELTFHRAGDDDLRWFYPLAAARWSYHTPVADNDGWRTESLTQAGMREAPIAAMMNEVASVRQPELRSPYIQSVTIERHGRLVLDQYFYGFSATQPHDVRSAGKSVTTLMVGRAAEETRGFSPESGVLSLLPQYQPVKNDDARKRRMSVANLMTMASGLACDDNDDASPGNEDTMQSRPAGTDWYWYTLDLPMIGEPGTRALYCSAGINLLGAIVQTETRVPLESYFNDRFAVPMQLGTYAMWLMPDPPEAYMGGGDYFRPRDFLKFGQLILDGGIWNGRRIVDSHWIRESVTARTAPEGEGDRYGYGWHITSIPVDGRAYEVISAGGNGGQLMLAVPALDAAIMVTAGNYNQFAVWRTFAEQAVTTVVRACER
jgi:CubicO group peptidase (beta-lactamase class C family)